MKLKKAILSLFFIIIGIFIVAPAAFASDTESGIGQTVSSKIIPECLLGSTINRSCDNVNVFIWLGINVGFYLFSFIGALALLFFVYGGFVLILSQGNPQKVGQGKNAILAAVIGMVIAFSAYALVTFLSNSIGVKTEYKLNLETQEINA